MNKWPPGPQVFHWVLFEFFQKFAEIFANQCLSPVSTTPVISCSVVSTTPAKNLAPMSINLCHGFSVIASVVTTGEQFIAGENDTGDNFIAGDNNTGEQWSPVTMTLAINLLPVTRTKTPWRWGAAKDRRKLKGINRRYLRLPKSATAAEGVIGTAMKSCIHKHPSHLDQRPLRRLKLNNAVLVWSFGGLRGLWSGYVRCLCAFSWLFQWLYRRLWPTSVAVADFSGRRKVCSKNRPLSSIQFIASEKLYRQCRWHRQTVYRRCRWHRWTIYDTGDNIFPQCCWYRSEITQKPKIYRRCQRHCQK